MAGALHNPNGIVVYSKSSYSLLYAEVMSRVENNTESDIASRQSSVRGRGNASGLVSICTLR